ncbi:MAG: RNA pseudouridine synthase [Bacteroidetes bacterium]|jgi:23S rRNA pseudouridine1911/1915/1917 synthase|nr:RNA pseudouridine synthase [Bacteroidota bacterium]
MLPPEIIFEDNHLIAINKRPGEISQGDKTNDVPLVEIVKQYLKDKYQKPGNVYAGLIHRIDRPVSGVLIFSKTGKAGERMSKIVRDRAFKKTYWAIVKNKPEQESATLVHHLLKNERMNKSFAYAEKKGDSKEAILHYQLIASSDRYFLLEVDPQTGRHHQIRAQLATIGSPIKGDLKYGFDRSNKDGSVSLHARQLEFIHPIKNEPVIITANPPVDPVWNAFMEILGQKNNPK